MRARAGLQAAFSNLHTLTVLNPKSNTTTRPTQSDMVSVHKQTDVSWWLHHIYLAAGQADEVQQAVLAVARLTFSHNASNEVPHHPRTSIPMVVLFLFHVGRVF